MAVAFRLLDQVPAKIASRLEHALSAEQRKATTELLGYESCTAGRLMVPAAVTLAPERTREETIGKLGGLSAPSHDYSQLSVTDGQRKLVGVVSLSDIVTSDDGIQVRGLMSSDVYSVSAHEDQAVAARLLQEADLLALPVVDGEKRVIGIIPIDDAMEVLEEEGTEDAHRSGSAEPILKPYRSATVFGLARSRFPRRRDLLWHGYRDDYLPDSARDLLVGIIGRRYLASGRHQATYRPRGVLGSCHHHAGRRYGSCPHSDVECSLVSSVN
ncbi:magnesium transporter [Nesterenkonia salmonea]|uniref:Magnesium transporter n=1 Tax=Nesterenkonia salmonea TaxID=1804987 RepID=A0A5R9BF79_9MICC|nr:CBS domain-containing protein [Nesterenkonia salmonea]TLP98851.1 magnesium transporter [Nesterenkonia salmonea]